ncbi:MAG: VOC family protein [Proteobacteria bacterium]|nr:VOC family protein [Pseudomonadota bacterium]
MSIGYVTIGALDDKKAIPFYDAVFGAIGLERKFSDGGWTGYGQKGQDSQDVFVVSATANGKPAAAGNGIMVAFKAQNTGEVQAAHAAGLKNGGSDEGAPGPRPADSKAFFGAYLRDPTGNKLCVFCRP